MTLQANGIAQGPHIKIKKTNFSALLFSKNIISGRLENLVYIYGFSMP